MNPLIVGPKSAPVIVLLHGWGASKEIWLPTMHSALAKTHRMIALDLPGVGGSSNIETSGAPEDLAQILLEQIDELGLENYAIIGHSQGANVAGRIAEIAGDSVNHLVLVAPALYSDRFGSAAHYLNPVYGTPLLNSFRLLAGLCGRFEETLPHVSPDALSGARINLRRTGYLYSSNTIVQLSSQLQGLIDSPFDITRLDPDLPVTIIHGALDLTVPISHSREAVLTRTQNTTLLEYADSMHCPMDTHLKRFVADIAKAVG